jgi:hypothetical protein
MTVTQDHVLFTYEKIGKRLNNLTGSEGMTIQNGGRTEPPFLLRLVPRWRMAEFDVELHPVVLYEESDIEGFYQREGSDAGYYIFPHTVDDDEGSSSDSDEGRQRRRMPSEEREMDFYLPRSSAIQCISKRDYVEHAGNNAVAGEGIYVGAGMFVTSKDSDDEED